MTTEDEHDQTKLNVVWNSQPVQIAKQWRDAVVLVTITHQLRPWTFSTARVALPQSIRVNTSDVTSDKRTLRLTDRSMLLICRSKLTEAARQSLTVFESAARCSALPFTHLI